MKELIHFKKQRELGDILSDTFKFLRLEYKPLFKALMRNAAIPFIILIAISAYFTSISADISFLNFETINATDIILPIIAILIAVLFYYGVLYGTILNYIKLYIQNEGVVDQNELKSAVKSQLGGLTGLSFGLFFTILFTFIILIAPSMAINYIFGGLILFFLFFAFIYFSTTVSLSFPVKVFKETNIVNSVKDSFRLIKGEWWMTFATILVMGLLVYVANIVFSVPVIIYSLVKTFTSADQISQGDVSGMIDWVYITLNAISTAIQYILAGIYAIAIAFIYFNLNEKINQTGTFETIDSIGSDL
ncbi:hypothetical protein [Leeuwenhoekiella sp. MAR_2009_132]|uniref:hypothetical protein n=1 Tax=Leeuwenhoekiella sp. MAR_2009_132 TaxID=1392489 RepID=UPI00048C570F|nr:hypothetical protein [Leeuwenhoekiella sp. MAR_2009_132]